MKRPKGPELKMPELKAPVFLADLYYDLRDRRLLPLVGLVVVAIGATPFLLGQNSETELPPAAAGAIAALRETNGKTSTLTVVEAEPGLRDYRKRLRGRKPTDPFRQLGGSKSGSGGSTASSSESPTSSSSTTTTTESSSTTSGSSGASPSPSESTPPPSPPGHSGSAPPHSPPAKEGGSKSGGEPSAGSGGSAKHPHATLYSFGVDVTIVHSSGSKAEHNKKKNEPETRKRVLPTTSLPGKKEQVVTYMGLSPKTRKPLFLVSTEVTGVFGEGKCVAGTSSCQLIELEPGFPEVFEYGEEGDRYSIKVTHVEFVVTGHV
ncbi:MAG TPA: hypothetical protein VFI09_04790 [Solirubrobacterales bacterium]|nr:hypothetical protein [Solirubrobacterales bacterium]